ncbi:hypothetical protein QVM41_28065 [Pseudomonas shirazica]|uniref:hypothetical protein n=1 Tax=Pseudomonas shirazica TaxID=1940636 RepID=UPI0035249FA1
MLRRFNMWQRRKTDFVDEKFTFGEHVTYIGVTFLFIVASVAVCVAALRVFSS